MEQMKITFSKSPDYQVIHDYFTGVLGWKDEKATEHMKGVLYADLHNEHYRIPTGGTLIQIQG